MTRLLLIVILASSLVCASPGQAAADVTAFWGVAPTPTSRAARGVAVGISLLVIGFEVEYGTILEDPARAAPGLRTGMVNGVIQTPTRTQLYLTAGAGLFRERLGPATATNVATNIGGGVKIPLVGPLRVRIDYRVFTLRGSPKASTPARLYVGGNLAF